MSDTLLKQYLAYLPVMLNEEGFPRPPLLAKHHNGQIDMAIMAVPQETIFRIVMEKFMADISVKEIIFGVDRYTKPGQGTKYKDVLTVFWWCGEHTAQHGFRFGVVNYRPPPNEIIEPIDFDNSYWNNIMWRIIDDDYQARARRLMAIADAPGGTEAIIKVRQQVIKAREAAGGPALPDDMPFTTKH